MLLLSLHLCFCVFLIFSFLLTCPFVPRFNKCFFIIRNHFAFIVHAVHLHKKTFRFVSDCQSIHPIRITKLYPCFPFNFRFTPPPRKTDIVLIYQSFHTSFRYLIPSFQVLFLPHMRICMACSLLSICQNRYNYFQVCFRNHNA